VNHLGWNLHAAFAGNEDDAAPVGTSHGRQAKTGEPNPTQHVGREEAHPVGIGDVGEGPGLENPEIVDQDLDIGILPHQGRCGIGRAEIAGESQHVAARRRSDRRHRRVNGGLGTAIDDDPSAFAGESSGNRVTNSGRAAGDQRQPVPEFHVHVV
jgi:hypothetical protein